MNDKESVPEANQDPQQVVAAASFLAAEALVAASKEERPMLVEELQDRLSEAGITVTDETEEPPNNETKGKYSGRTREQIFDQTTLLRNHRGLSRLEANIRAERLRRKQSGQS